MITDHPPLEIRYWFKAGYIVQTSSNGARQPFSVPRVLFLLIMLVDLTGAALTGINTSSEQLTTK